MVTERLKVNKENLTSLGKRPIQLCERFGSLSCSFPVRLTSGKGRGGSTEGVPKLYLLTEMGNG